MGNPSSTAVAPAQPGPGRLRRELGLPGLALFGMAAIGPGSVMAVWGEVSHATHGVSVLAYLVGLVAMMGVAHGYGLLAQELPSAGSAFAFATARLGQVPGFAAGWLILLDYFLVPSLAALFGSVALQSLWPAVPQPVFLVLLIGSVTACNVAGVRVSARWLLATLLVSIGVVAWFCLVALSTLLRGDGPVPSWSPLWPAGGPPMALVLGSVSIATLSYLGFDAVSAMSEDARDPQRDVRAATLLALASCGALFITVAWLAEDLSRGAPAPASPEVAFLSLCRHIGGPALATAVAVVLVLGTFPAALAGQSAMSRVSMAMARAGVLPERLSRVHGPTGSPVAAALVGGAGALAVALLFAGHIATLVRLLSIGAMGAFVLVEVSLLRTPIPARGWGAQLGYRAIPVFALLVLGTVIAFMDSTSHVLALIWLLAGAIVLSWSRQRHAHPH
jgi:amino acid transporter